MQSIGERLEEARKRRGISIREAAETTKIRSDFLAGFEENNFDLNLPEIYVRGFLRTYAVLLNIFFVLMELFTAFYSAIPEHAEHFKYLYIGLHGHNELAPFMWVSAALVLTAAALLINSRARASERLLTLACVAVVISIWIEKGLGMVVTGFVPNPLGVVTEYLPSFPEAMITMGVYGIGLLIITLLYKIALSVRHQIST